MINVLHITAFLAAQKVGRVQQATVSNINVIRRHHVVSTISLNIFQAAAG
jgi:hypothetical protein